MISLETRDNLRLTFADNGVGIDSQVIERVFDPFYTTKPDGLGMGLSISRSIIEAHNGWMTVAPNGARGAIFSITYAYRQQGDLETRGLRRSASFMAAALQWQEMIRPLLGRALRVFSTAVFCDGLG